MAGTTPTAGQEWRSHWPLVTAGLAGLSFYSIITYSLGTFMEPLEKAFGWSRAEVSFGLTLFAATAMLGGPLVGMAIDRFGTRRIAAVGMALSSLAFAAIGLTSGNILVWYGLILLYAVISLSAKATIWSAGISSVFNAGRSLALATMLSGTALAQSLAPIAANHLIERFDWRAAYWGLGLIWGGLATLLVALFFIDARALGRRRPDQAAAPSVPLGGLTPREALRDPRILRIAGANLAASLVGSGISVHMVPILSETVAGRATAVQLMAIGFAAGLAGKLLFGWALDRWQSSLVPFMAYALSGAAYLLLLDVFKSIPVLAGAVFLWAFSAGASLQTTTYLVSRYAGLRAFGTIFGVISSMMMAGTALSPWISGLIHDATGSYTGLLTVAGPVALIAGLLLLGLGPYPDYSADNKPLPA